MVPTAPAATAVLAAFALLAGVVLGEQIARRSTDDALTRVERELTALHAAVAAQDSPSAGPACPPVACAASDVDYDRIARLVAVSPPLPERASPVQAAPPSPSEDTRKGVADVSQMLDRAEATGRWTGADAAAFRASLQTIDDDGERDTLRKRLIVLVNSGVVHPTVRRPF
jgi:hypothetical protein